MIVGFSLHPQFQQMLSSLNGIQEVIGGNNQGQAN